MLICVQKPAQLTPHLLSYVPYSVCDQSRAFFNRQARIIIEDNPIRFRIIVLYYFSVKICTVPQNISLGHFHIFMDIRMLDSLRICSKIDGSGNYRFFAHRFFRLQIAIHFQMRVPIV